MEGGEPRAAFVAQLGRRFVAIEQRLERGRVGPPGGRPGDPGGGVAQLRSLGVRRQRHGAGHAGLDLVEQAQPGQGGGDARMLAAGRGRLLHQLADLPAQGPPQLGHQRRRLVGQLRQVERQLGVVGQAQPVGPAVAQRRSAFDRAHTKPSRSPLSAHLGPLERGLPGFSLGRVGVAAGELGLPPLLRFGEAGHLEVGHQQVVVEVERGQRGARAAGRPQRMLGPGRRVRGELAAAEGGQHLDPADRVLEALPEGFGVAALGFVLEVGVAVPEMDHRPLVVFAQHRLAGQVFVGPALGEAAQRLERPGPLAAAEQQLARRGAAAASSPEWSAASRARAASSPARKAAKAAPAQVGGDSSRQGVSTTRVGR